MIGLKFDISGRYAFFKNPEINKGVEISFSHIHKPALLGILGAKMGYDGRGQLKKHDNKLEYYEKLKNIKLSIIPHKAIFNTHIEGTNNATGFANENGQAQMLRKQILNDVKWTIIIDKSSVDTEIYKELLTRFQTGESVYPMSLGNKRYFANVSNISEIELNQVGIEDIYKIDSIFKEDIKVEIEKNTFDDSKLYGVRNYYPTSVNEFTLYEDEPFIFTNGLLEVNSSNDIKECDGNYYYFI